LSDVNDEPLYRSGYKGKLGLDSLLSDVYFNPQSYLKKETKEDRENFQ